MGARHAIERAIGAGLYLLALLWVPGAEAEAGSSGVVQGYLQCLNAISPYSLAHGDAEIARTEHPQESWPDWKWSRSIEYRDGGSALEGSRNGEAGYYFAYRDKAYFVRADEEPGKYMKERDLKHRFQVPESDPDLHAKLEADLVLRLRSMIFKYRTLVDTYGTDHLEREEQAPVFLERLRKCQNSPFAKVREAVDEQVGHFERLARLEKPSLNPRFVIGPRPHRVPPIHLDERGKISRKECGSFDLSSHFGPPENYGLGVHQARADLG